MKKYNSIICGGTFDHLHRGHKEFIKFALSYGKKIVIGITSDKYINKIKIKENKEAIELFVKRKKTLEEFLEKEKKLSHVKIIKIDDLFGKTLSKNFSIDAIVVSRNSIKGAREINDSRKRLNLPDLKILNCPMILAEDRKPISSSRIRKGEIDREGKVYSLWISSDLLLTEKLRKTLKKPFGTLSVKLKDFQNIDVSKLITVGDNITKSFNNFGLFPKLSIVDFCSNREKKFSQFKELGFLGKEKVFKVNNLSGSLNQELVKMIVYIFNNLNIAPTIILKIKGEEDLSVLPVLIFSPLGYVVFYGQPGGGVVRIDVSEEIKEKAVEVLNEFEVISKNN